ncbi:MAG: molybdopterin molybdotransferase MoeA, partial [Anaerolineales bacterium]|nr:molybdopterin molybdotransferase MoeA [Anaerolineales bacterium]
MTEFLTLLPPDSAREKLLSQLTALSRSTVIESESALGRVSAEDIFAPHPLPAFARTTVDGFAVRAQDTYGVSESLPGYLKLIGEVPMGSAPDFEIGPGQSAIIHTGGMLPKGADAALMLEYAQSLGDEIEILKAVADGENILRAGEDVGEDQRVIRRGTRLRPAEIGGLMALGITSLRVANKVRVGIISSGDEVIPAGGKPRPGQVRDVNTHTLAALVAQSGGQPLPFGILRDDFGALQAAAAQALSECDVLLITAGSSASTRDMTADVINTLGPPGVLVHGINTRPGKPTILGLCDGKAVIGLPGNPVSALVNGYMLVVPLIEKLLGQLPRPRATLRATLAVNLASQSGREDWWPVRLRPEGGSFAADPIFGKSNLIFSLAAADGL